ncbi:MAG: large repetitive protein [Actinomycetota bacterium]|nr:large repetitive protein [Actinomycetota bacterium]
MSIMVDPSLNWIFLIIAGDNFPQGDEDKLRELAAVWDQAAVDIVNAVSELNALAGHVQENVGGDVGRKFYEYAVELGNNAPVFASTAEKQAYLARDFALNVEHAKYSMLIQIAFTAAEIIWALSNPFTAGLVPGFITAGRFAVQKILSSFMGRIGAHLAMQAAEEAIQEVAMDALAQIIQFLEGNRHAWNVQSTYMSAAVGGAAGFVGGGLGLIGHKLTPDFAATRWGEGANEGLTEIIVGAGAAGATGGDFDTLWAGGLNGALSGAASWTPEGHGGNGPATETNGPDLTAGPGGPNDPTGMGTSGSGTGSDGQGSNSNGQPPASTPVGQPGPGQSPPGNSNTGNAPPSQSTKGIPPPIGSNSQSTAQQGSGQPPAQQDNSAPPPAGQQPGATVPAGQGLGQPTSQGTAPPVTVTQPAVQQDNSAPPVGQQQATTQPPAQQQQQQQNNAPPPVGQQPGATAPVQQGSGQPTSQGTAPPVTVAQPPAQQDNSVPPVGQQQATTQPPVQQQNSVPPPVGQQSGSQGALPPSTVTQPPAQQQAAPPVGQQQGTPPQSTVTQPPAQQQTAPPVGQQQNSALPPAGQQSGPHQGTTSTVTQQPGTQPPTTVAQQQSTAPPATVTQQQNSAPSVIEQSATPTPATATQPSAQPQDPNAAQPPATSQSPTDISPAANPARDLVTEPPSPQQSGDQTTQPVAVQVTADLDPHSDTSGEQNTFSSPTDWGDRRDTAYPAKQSTERFDPDNSGRTGNGQLPGKITQIRYDLRRFEVGPGQWVREFTVPIKLVSDTGSVTPEALKQLGDQVNQSVDAYYNQRYHLPGGDQLHITVEFDPDGVPVEVIDSTVDKGKPETNQTQWDVRDNPNGLTHEVLHFLGLGEGYADPSMLFNRQDQPGIMGKDGWNGATFLTDHNLGKIDEVAKAAGPLRDHGLKDQSPPPSSRPTGNPSPDFGPDSLHSPANAPKQGNLETITEEPDAIETTTTPQPRRETSQQGAEREAREQAAHVDDDLAPDPAPPVALTAAAVRDALPDYLADSKGLGPSTQLRPTNNADIRPGLIELAPQLAGNPALDIIQGQIDTNAGSFLGDGRPFTITVGKRSMELTVRGEFDWAGMTVDNTATDTEKAIPSGKDVRKVENSAADSRNTDLNVSGFISAAPPLVISASLQIPTGINSAHDTKTSKEAGSSSNVEIDGMRQVKAPITFTYSLVDSNNRPVRPAGPADRNGHAPNLSVNGDVDLSVPTTFTRPGATPLNHLTQAPPSKFGVEEAVSTTPENNGFFHQVAADLPPHLMEIGAPGRSVLQNFLSDANIKKNLPAMTIYDATNPDRGWVRSDPLIKNSNSKKWSSNGNAVEMRAVARQVRVIETVDGVKNTDTDSYKNVRSEKNSAKHNVGGSLMVGAGADVGAVFFAVGPTASWSRESVKSQEHTQTNVSRNSAERTGEAVRYHTVYDIQVRSVGHPAVTLAGHVDAHLWATKDRADNAQLGPNPTPAAPPNAVRAHFAPSHIENSQSLGGSIIDDFTGGDRLYRSIVDVLQNVPGRKAYHLSSDKFIRQFDNADFASGLSSSINDILNRDDKLRTSLSDQQLSHLIDTMLTESGLTIPLVKNGTFHDYHTNITLRAQLNDVGDLELLTSPQNIGPTGDKTVGTSKTKEKTGTAFADTNTKNFSLGVQSRVAGGIGQASGTWLGAVKGGKIWTNSTTVGSDSKSSINRTHGDTLDPAGDLGSREFRQFTGTLAITPRVTSYVRLNLSTRRISFGSYGKSVPALVPSRQTPGNAQPLPQNIDLRLLVPENLVTTVPPAQVEIAPPVPQPILAPPAISRLGDGRSRALDGVEVLTFLGTDHLQTSAKGRLRDASGDPIFEFADGVNSMRIADRLSPESLKSDPRLFSRPIVVAGLHYGRRAADVDGQVAVALTPVNPQVVSAAEYQKIKHIQAGGSSVGKSKGSSTSVDATITGVAAMSGPVTSTTNNVKSNPFGVFIASITPWGKTWGTAKGGDLKSAEKTTFENGPVRKTLVRVNINAEVVAETKVTGNIDKFGLLPGQDLNRSGEQFTMPGSVLMWVTDSQLAALHNAPQPAPAANPPGRTLPPPVSMGQNQVSSLGIGGVISTIDLTGHIAQLHTALVASMGQEAADRLLPKSSLDTSHDNHRELNRVLSDINRSVNSTLNGGKISPLRLEDRFSGRTYYVTVDAQVTAAPTFTGIDHVDKLSTEDSVTVSTTKEKTSSRTIGGLFASLRPSATMANTSDTPQPGQTVQTRGHGPASGNMSGGISVDGTASTKSTKDTNSSKTDYKQSASISGPVGTYTAPMAFDIRIERRLGVDENGNEKADQVVATAHADIPDVKIQKLAEESLPAPTGDAARHGVAGPITSVAERGDTPTTAWRQANGHATLPDTGTFAVEHFFGNMTDIRKAAEQALTESGVTVDTATIAALKAGITPAAFKAGFQAMVKGEFTVPLPGKLGRDLEIHARLGPEPRLGSVSGGVEVDGSVKRSDETKTERKTGPTVSATGIIPNASGGVPHPSGSSEFGERRPFGGLFAGSQNDYTLGGKNSQVELKAGAPANTTTSPQSATAVKTDDKITQAMLHNVEFRFVARPKTGQTADHTGITTMNVNDAYVVRTRPDPANPLPASMMAAATALTTAGKTWSDAVKSLEGLRRQPTPAGITAAEAAVADAENAWWQGKDTYDRELESARLTQEERDARDQAERDRLAQEAADRQRREDEARAEREAQAARDKAEADRRAAEEARAAEEKAARERAEKEAAERRAAERRAAEQRAAEQRAAAEQKAAEEKAAAEREAAERKAAEQRAAEEKATAERIEREVAEQRAAEQRAAEQRAAEQKVAEEKAAAERKVAEQRAAEQRAAAEKAAEEKATAERKATEQRAAEQRAAEEKATAERIEREAAEQRAAEQRAAEQRAAEQKVAEEKAAAERIEREAAERKATEQRAAEEQAAKRDAAEAKRVAEQKTAKEQAEKEKASQERAEWEAAVLKAADDKAVQEQKAAQEHAEKDAAEKQSTTDENVEPDQAAERESTERRVTEQTVPAPELADEVVADTEQDEDTDPKQDDAGQDDQTGRDDSQQQGDNEQIRQTALSEPAVAQKADSGKSVAMDAGSTADPDLSVDDVEFVPLASAGGDVIGVGFPRLGETEILLTAFEHNAGEQDTFSVAVHHGDDGFAVTRKDGTEVRLDERGVVRLMMSTSGDAWRQSASLVFLSCDVTSTELSALTDLVRAQGYDGSVRGTDGRVEVAASGDVRVLDGGVFRDADGAMHPRVSGKFDDSGGTVVFDPSPAPLDSIELPGDDDAFPLLLELWSDAAPASEDTDPDADLLGQDLFGTRKVPPAPAFLAGQDYSSLTAGQGARLLELLDMARDVPTPQQLSPDALAESSRHLLHVVSLDGLKIPESPGHDEWLTVLWTDSPRSEINQQLPEHVVVIGLNEVFNAESPMTLQSFFATEMSKPDGRTAAAGILRLEILRRFGGVSVEGDPHDFDFTEAAGHLDQAWNHDSADSAVFGIPKGHPVASLLLEQLRDGYRQPEPLPVSPDVDDLSTTELTKKIIQTLVRGLRVRGGDLHLNAVAAVLANYSKAGVVWTAVLTFLASRPELASQVKTVTWHHYGIADELAILRKILLSRAAGQLIDVSPIPPPQPFPAELTQTASLNWPDWL